MISLYSHSSWKKVWIIVCRTCTTNTRETECFIAIDSCYTIFHNSKVCMWVKIGQKISFRLPCFCWLNHDNHDLWYGVCFLAPKKPVCFSMAFFQRKWEKYLELLKRQIIGYKHGFWMVINTTLADSRWRKKLIKLIICAATLLDIWYLWFSKVFLPLWLCSFWPIWKNQMKILALYPILSVVRKGRKCLLLLQPGWIKNMKILLLTEFGLQVQW